MKVIKLTPTKEIVEYYIALYVRFLKEKQIYHNIRFLFEKNIHNYINNITFVKTLYKLKPTQYFSSFSKGWYWDEYIKKYKNINRRDLESLYDEWKEWIDKTSYDKYDWIGFEKLNIF